MNDKIRDELVTLTDDWGQAIVSNDAEAIGQFMSDDWVIVGETGVTERSDFLGLVGSGDLTHEAMTGNVVRVSTYGDAAVVTCRGTNNGTFKGNPFSSDEWITDIYVKQEGHWRCVLTHLTPAKTK